MHNYTCSILECRDQKIISIKQTIHANNCIYVVASVTGSLTYTHIHTYIYILMENTAVSRRMKIIEENYVNSTEDRE